MLLRECVTSCICISLASSESLDECDEWGINIPCLIKFGGVFFQFMVADASICGEQPLREFPDCDIGQARDGMVDADAILPGDCVHYQVLDGFGDGDDCVVVTSVRRKHIVDDMSIILVGTNWVMSVWSRISRVNPWDSGVGGIYRIRDCGSDPSVVSSSQFTWYRCYVFNG